MRNKSGYRIPKPQVIRGKCCECMANYGDGRVDCQHRHCPLYAKHPFRKLTPDFSWVFGKWTKKHVKAAFMKGMSQEEYIRNVVWIERKYRLGFNAMFRAKCYDCNSDFIDGRQDCRVPGCPLYFWMPYREQEPTYEWMFDLSWTRKHTENMFVENLSREAYLEHHFDYINP